MAVERRGPAVGSDSNKKEGKGEMTKTPISLQDLRRSLYVKAKAEPTWRFWGLYVHICKMETLQETYWMAKSNDYRLDSGNRRLSRTMPFPTTGEHGCQMGVSYSRAANLAMALETGS
jgi:hypothetical protein